jgi:DNA-directed RNA polymerase subunit beta'
MTDAQKYIIGEIQKVYQSQGIMLGDKHIEVIVAQMGRYQKVENPGDSGIIPGEIKDKYVIDEINSKLRKENKKEIKATPMLLGITVAALKTESFLAAASFQEQVRVLSDAAIMGKNDYLRGLKENVIIGKMIPVGENAIIKEVEA